MNPTIQKMIEMFFTPDELFKKQPPVQRASKHMLPRGIRATKAYADGRQKAPHNQRNMRKRK